LGLLGGLSEEGDDVGGLWTPVRAGGDHEGLLGLEENLRRPVDGAVNTQLLGIATIQLAEEVDDTPPDVGRNEFDAPNTTFLDHVQELIGLAKLVTRGRRRAALPRPEPVLRDLEDRTLDHADAWFDHA